jgi:hypothetical protein
MRFSKRGEVNARGRGYQQLSECKERGLVNFVY